MNEMLNTLREAGLEMHVLGDKIVVMPFGGRIIGLYPDGRDNALWTNPALSSASELRSLISGDGWANLGGDRTWISPEIETNIGDPSDFAGSYDVPRAVDPARYQVVESDGESVTLRTKMDVWFHRSRCLVPLSVTKKITVIPPDFDVPTDVSAAGYVLESTLQAEEPLPEASLPGLWNLLQVPGGGQITIPTNGTAVPRAFIGKPVVTAKAGLVTCEVNTPASFKFGVHVGLSRGVSCYLRSGEGKAVLVVRRFYPCPESRYGDVPCDDAKAEGFIHQVYVDDGALGGFGELEHHSPALLSDGEICDRCETWAFSGPESTLRDIAACSQASNCCATAEGD